MIPSMQLHTRKSTVLEIQIKHGIGIRVSRRRHGLQPIRGSVIWSVEAARCRLPVLEGPCADRQRSTAA